VGDTPPAPHNGGPAVFLTHPVRRITVWVILLAALTGAAVAAMHLAGAESGEELVPAVLVIAFAPTLAALAVVAATPRLRGLWALLRQVAAWRAGWRWYALVIVAPAVLVLITSLISGLLGGPTPEAWLVLPATGVVVAALGPWFAGMVEEIAWRGFAQPLLQQRFGALVAAVLIGVIWATWHEWPVLAPGGAEEFSLIWVLQSYVRFIATAVLYAWLYNTTGSLVLVMVAHLAHNVAVELLPRPEVVGAGWGLILAALYVALAAVVVLATNPHTLTRSGSDTR
jgi:uncharacterized protein